MQVSRAMNEMPVRLASLVEEAIDVEPALRSIFEQAASCQYHERYNRWDDYSHFKGFITQLVGWEGRNPKLGGSDYFFACVTLIDYLLPPYGGSPGAERWLEAESAEVSI